MTADIIEFGSYQQAPTVRPRRVVSEADDTRETAEPLTTTAKNTRMRSARYEVWQKANALTSYWRALLDLESAVRIAKMHGLKEARAQIETGPEARYSMLASYREALGKQLLTPAHDVASVNWKRRKLSKLTYIDVKKEVVEKSIADDIAFLDAHPTRNLKLEQHRRQ